MKPVLSVRILIALLLLATSTFAFAGSPDPAPAPDPAMARLDFLVGEWKGEGWMMTREGKRETFASSEVIRRKLLDTALLVEGTHTGFEAMAVVTWDAKAQQYRWRSFTSRGAGADAQAKLVGERTLQWFPSESARYTIEISADGQWVEVGEYSRDGGKTWSQFFEMRLQRVGAAPEPATTAPAPGA
jgi:hypothetical protein